MIWRRLLVHSDSTIADLHYDPFGQKAHVFVTVAPRGFPMPAADGALCLLRERVTAGAIVTTVLLAAALYWPPQFRQVQWRWGGPRLFIVLVGMVTIGWLYQTIGDPGSLLAVVESTAILMLLSVPLQRALS